MYYHRVTEHSPHFSFISLAFNKDKTWFNKDLRKVEVEVQVVVEVFVIIDNVDRLECRNV